MKTALRRRLAVSALALMTLGATAAFSSGSAERGPLRRVTTAAPESEARVIVKFKADSALMRTLSTQAQPQHAQALSARLGLSLVDGRGIGPRTQVLKSSSLSSQQLAQRLSAESDVEYAEVDGRKYLTAAPNDALYSGGQTTVTPAVGQWYLRAPTSATIDTASTIVSSINVEPAWAITTGSSSVVVADIDTGVRFEHPDLAGKLLLGYDFISNTTISKDTDGRDADATDPGDFGCGETTSSWHGTQTAGLIGAATNNTIGMASVGRDVMVLPLRVLGCGGGLDSDIQAAIRWAVGMDITNVPTNTHPAKVINLSLGGPVACSQGYVDAIADANAHGAVVVVSAGNDGLDVGSPANCAGAIGVAGVQHSGTKVSYSDLGAKISLAAPAGNCPNGTATCLYPILTTSNSGATTPVASIYTNGGNDASLGTSFSSPLVAGTAALMFSANPSLTPAQVLAALKSSARAFPTSGAGASVRACNAPTSVTDTTTAQDNECYCTTTTCGAGLLDAGAAVTAVGTATAHITASSASVNVGSTITLDGTQSAGSTNRSITSYQWALTSGSTSASLTGSTTGSSVTLSGVAVGSAVVALTVTDSTGAQSTTSVTVTVAAAPVASSGGGGGAMSLGWLLVWLASLTAVWAVTPRRSARPQRF